MIKHISGIALSCILLLSACNTERNVNGAAEAPPKKYPVITLHEADTTLALHYVADIAACKNIELHARISGILDKIYVDEGQYVKKGQLLFKINDEEARISLDQAKAAYKSALADSRITEVELSRTRSLVEKKIVSPSEMELVQARLDAQKARAEEAGAAKAAAAARLSYTNVYAPFDGIIDRLPLKEGSLLTNGSLLTTISDIHDMYAYFKLSEQEYISFMQAGAQGPEYNEVALVLADGSHYPFKGKVVRAESEIDENTGSIAFRASFPNPEKLLKHGATGTLVISRPVKSALLVPQKSVFEIQDKSFVYVLDKNNKVSMRNFIAGQRLGEYYVVLSGLKVSDRIIYEGVQTLREGTSIHPENAVL